uniref:Carbohydrate-binding X8 domain-containing protein n=1 Tax=Noccaea caerulescens TaxID=107243 RepID=A0A1J3H4A1_NOCCA
MAILLPLFLLFSVATYSNAAVCVCKDGNEQALQKVIDYACGSGADCTQIEETGACFQPNTIKNHCDVAVNSFYQKKAPTGATCDFNGAAFISTSPPSNASSCLSSSGSTGTPIIGAPSTGNSTNGPPSTGNSTTGMPINGTATNGMPTSSVFPGNTMGPSGSTGFDPSGGEELFVRTTTLILLTAIAAVALRV